MMIYGSVAVVFFSLSTVTNAVLQGINHMQTPLKNAIISLILHVGILCVMLFVFKMGIYGVLYSNILFALTMCIFNGLAIGKFLNYRQEVKKTFILPTLASGVMGAAAYGAYFLIHLILKSNILGVLVAIVVAVGVYGVLLLKLRCVDEKELVGLPGGAKIVNIARKFHLL
jgi:stage V sporulation protein B